MYRITNNHDTTYGIAAIGSGWNSPSATTADAAGNVWVVDCGLEAYCGTGTINLLVPTGGGSYNQTAYQNISGIRTLMVNQVGKLYGFAYNQPDYAQIWTGGTPPHNLGKYPVGTVAPTAIMTVDFMNGATAGGFNVTTQGASTGDFQTSGGTCTPGAYVALQGCTVQVTFTPQAPGMRTGALVVTDDNGNVLGTNYIYGVGLAPSIAYTPGTFSTPVPSTSGLNAPSGMALDEAGNLYVTDGLNLSMFALGSSTATFTENVSQTSMGIAVDGAGNLWVAQPWANSILLKTLKSPGVYTDSAPINIGSATPYDVAVDGSGNVYFADPNTNDVLKETLTAGSYVQTIVASGLSTPSGVTVDSSGNVYITDTGNKQVLEETPSGSTYTQTVVANTGLSSPQHVAVDPNGNVYISDESSPARIIKETPSGGGTFIQTTLQATGMTQPVGLALDAAGDLYVADPVGQAIDELNVSTAPLTFAFPTTVANSESSPISTNLLNYGNAPLNISSISIPGGFASDPMTTCALSSGVLASSTSCSLGIDFAPTSGVPYSGTVTVTDNNLNALSTTQSIALSGAGSPDVTLLPASGTLPAGTVGAAYSQTFTAGGGTSPYTYAQTIFSGTMPAGLSFSNGLLSGTPSASGSFTFSIVATDASSSPGPYSSSSQSYSLTMAAAPVVIGISPASVPDGAVGIPYSQTVTASAGSGSYTYAVTAGSLPAWMSLNATTGVLAGTPTAAGPTAFTITATDAVAEVTASQAYSPTIDAVAAAAPTQSAGSSNIGSAASTTTLTFTFNVPAAVASINVVTQGVANKDFTDAASGSCTAVGYSVGDTCTVDVTFTPQAAGTRYGAVLIEDALGNVLGTGYVSGMGTGPQVTFQPGAESRVASAAAPFNLAEPAGVAVDAGGNLYIPDYENGAVYKETLSGGSYAQSTIATLGHPTGVALDGAGNVYIAAGPDGSVYKETPLGNNTYAQSEITNSAGSPYGIAVDGGGNVFVVDPPDNAIYLLTLSAGSYSQSTIISTGLNDPNGIAVDASGNLYIADPGNHQVWKETLSGGSYTPSAIGSGLQNPEGVLLDGSGNVYISDSAAEQIFKETWSGSAYTQSVVPIGSQTSPYGIAMDASGDLFIADATNDRVLKEDYTDQPSLTFANSTNVGSADSENPISITLLNSGNATLIFTVPGMGTNPAIVNSSFTLDSSSSCTPISVGGTSGSLAAGASCAYAVDFTPQASGVNSGTLTVSDNSLNNASAAQSISLFGTGAQPVITVSPAAGTLTPGVVGLAYSQSFTAGGGTGPYTFSFTGTLPPGLTLSTAGVLTGTPITAGGPWSFNITATGTVGGSQVTQGYTLSITQGTATITLAGLSQVYTGSPLAATATTVPAGLSVSISYSQGGLSVAAPTGAGSFAVTATIADPNYTGTASGTLLIGQAPAAVTLSGLSQTFTGYPLAAIATTNPAALTVAFTYSGSSTAPTAPGSYAVIGTIANPNYTGATTGTMTISQASATVTLAGLSQTYTGSALTATATTDPAGLNVSLTYDGSSSAPTAAGSYAVVGTIASPNYTGTASGTMTISKAAATVTLSRLSQTYTGSALAATATANPGSLNVSLTYNGSSTAPAPAGSYAVVGTINDLNYAGTASGTLVIGTAATAVSVAASANPAVMMNSVSLTATVSSSVRAPVGEVSFLDGTTPLGSAAVSGGVATFTTATLVSGTHSITATYIGSSDFTASSSIPLALSVVDLSLGDTSGAGGGSSVDSQTTNPGGSASYTVALAPSTGTTFPDAITLAVTGLPQGATATLGTPGWTEQAPTSWTLPANEPVSNISLTFQIPAQAAAATPNDGPAHKLPLVAVALLLLPFVRKGRKVSMRMNRCLCLLLIAAGITGATSLTGCVGPASQPQQTYRVSVTVTAGTLVHTTQLTLTVR